MNRAALSVEALEAGISRRDDVMVTGITYKQVDRAREVYADGAIGELADIVVGSLRPLSPENVAPLNSLMKSLFRPEVRRSRLYSERLFVRSPDVNYGGRVKLLNLGKIKFYEQIEPKPESDIPIWRKANVHIYPNMALAWLTAGYLEADAHRYPPLTPGYQGLEGLLHRIARHHFRRVDNEYRYEFPQWDGPVEQIGVALTGLAGLK